MLYSQVRWDPMLEGSVVERSFVPADTTIPADDSHDIVDKCAKTPCGVSPPPPSCVIQSGKFRLVYALSFLWLSCLFLARQLLFEHSLNLHARSEMYFHSFGSPSIFWKGSVAAIPSQMVFNRAARTPPGLTNDHCNGYVVAHKMERFICFWVSGVAV